MADIANGVLTYLNAFLILDLTRKITSTCICDGAGASASGSVWPEIIAVVAILIITFFILRARARSHHEPCECNRAHSYHPLRNTCA